MKERLNIRMGVVIGIILLAALTRFFPVYNFSPLAAMALFGGAYLSKKWLAFLIPVSTMLISDIVLNNTIYAHLNEGFTIFYPGSAWQYGAYILITLVGIGMLSHEKSTKRVVGASLMGSALFFLVSNFGAWASGMMYPMTGAGLITAIAAGLPFLKATIMGDLFYSAVLFGGFYLLQQRFGKLRLERVKV